MDDNTYETGSTTIPRTWATTSRKEATWPIQHRSTSRSGSRPGC